MILYAKINYDAKCPGLDSLIKSLPGGEIHHNDWGFIIVTPTFQTKIIYPIGLEEFINILAEGGIYYTPRKF
jgi:hypothetical protein